MLLYAVLVFNLYTICYGYIDIGKYLKVCDRNSDEANDCIAEAVQDGIAAMAGGIEEMGVPSIDPYHQKELRAEYNNNQISAKMNMKDIYVHGLKGAKVHSARLRADEDKFHLEVDLTSPRVFVTGQYHGEGRYNSLKIAAKGSFNSTMSISIILEYNIFYLHN
uniref:Putative odorant binding protein 2 n=1 Tax=Corcyra cephalonica TaxID=139036 RepID=A0A8K1P923_CORCP|nr:putative odorant binding protein 2 [Corcyra cephalonica]